MSFVSMAKEMRGYVQCPLSLAQTKINEALGLIYDSCDWSFQDIESAWLTPGMVFSSGTTTVTVGSNQVVGDATAAALWAAYTGTPFLTELQYRSPNYSLYNIVAFDGANTLTLDRPWMEPVSGSGQTYMIYQAYFLAPYADWRKFVELRDTTNARRLDYWSYSQADLAARDPQRTNFSDPCYVVPHGVDLRVTPATGSGPSYVPAQPYATYGTPVYELWPQQLSVIAYTFTGKRRGPMLVNPTDTVPYPLTEELVKHRAMELLYLWKMGQMEAKAPASGRGMQFLSQAAHAEYMEILPKILSVDVNLRNDAVTRVARSGGASEPYANRLGGLNIGGYPGY